MGKKNNVVENVVIQALNGLEDGLLQSFMQWTGNTLLDMYSNRKALKTSEEGIPEEYIKQKLKSISKDFKDETENTSLFTEEELKEKFKSLYQKSEANLEGIDEDALFKCFKIYAAEYTKHLEKQLSIGEKQLLKRTEEIDNKMTKMLSKEDFEERAKKNTEMLEKLCKDVPLIHIINNQTISIKNFDYKYGFFNSTFDFVENHSDYIDEEDSLVLSLILNNAGNTIIKTVTISDFVLRYCIDSFDDDPNFSFRIVEISKFQNNITETLNILPGCDQKIHLIFKDNYDEEEFGYKERHFRDYEYHKAQACFKLTVDGCLEYDIILSIGRSPQNEEDLVGRWTVDDVSMTMLKDNS